MCACACVCVFVRAFLKLFYYIFYLKKKYIDDGRCLCMSVCMYVELNWFPGKATTKK